MNENFIKFVGEKKSGWLENAKRRQRWSWLRRITLKPHIKYLRLRRVFLLFLHGSASKTL